jgi:hypothetical protein
MVVSANASQNHTRETNLSQSDEAVSNSSSRFRRVRYEITRRINDEEQEGRNNQ